MIDHIDVCLCICKMRLQQSSLKFIINVIQTDTCTTECDECYRSCVREITRHQNTNQLGFNELKR